MIYANANGATLVAKPPPLAEFDITLSTTGNDTIFSSGGTSSVVVHGRNVTQHANATVDHGAIITQRQVSGPLQSGVWRNPSTSVASMTTTATTATLSRVSDGTASTIFDTPYLSRAIDSTISRSTGATQNDFVSFATGTLGRHIADNIDNAIAADANGFDVSGRLFIVASSGYIRSSQCWLSAYVYSSTPVFSPFESPFTPALVAVTGHDPVYIANAHYTSGLIEHLGADGRFYRVNMDWTVVSPKEIADVAIGIITNVIVTSDGFTYDTITVAEMMAHVEAYKILPQTAYAAKISNNGNPSAKDGENLPFLHVNQNRVGSVFEVQSIVNAHVAIAMAIGVESASRADYYLPIINHDSSSSYFVPVNGKFLVMTAAETSINAALNAITTGAHLTEGDVSGFADVN